MNIYRTCLTTGKFQLTFSVWSQASVFHEFLPFPCLWREFFLWLNLVRRNFFRRQLTNFAEKGSNKIWRVKMREKEREIETSFSMLFFWEWHLVFSVFVLECNACISTASEQNATYTVCWIHSLSAIGNYGSVLLSAGYHYHNFKQTSENTNESSPLNRMHSWQLLNAEQHLSVDNDRVSLSRFVSTWCQ